MPSASTSPEVRLSVMLSLLKSNRGSRFGRRPPAESGTLSRSESIVVEVTYRARSDGMSSPPRIRPSTRAYPVKLAPRSVAAAGTGPDLRTSEVPFVPRPWTVRPNVEAGVIAVHRASNQRRAGAVRERLTDRETVAPERETLARGGSPAPKGPAPWSGG